MGDQSASWHARLYEPGDEEGIVALYARVFGYEHTPEWWRWKIKTLPTKIELTWVAVSNDGRIVGHTAGISSRMRLMGKVRHVIVNVDAMTAPEFRRQGILLALGEAGNQHWRKMGYAAVVGLPNEQWGSRITALGWERMFPLVWLRFPLHIGRTLSRPNRLPRGLSRPAHILGEVVARSWARTRTQNLMRHSRSSGINIEKVRSAGADFDKLWSDLECHYDNCIVRDAQYVQWRFLSALPSPYEVLVSHRGDSPTGYIAYRTAGLRDVGNGYIADLFTAPDDEASAHALIGAALQNIWKAGAGMALVTAAPGSDRYAILRSAGAFRAAAVASFDYDLILLDPQLYARALAENRRWLASGSDSDVV